MKFVSLFSFLSSLIICVPLESFADDWPQFRGINGSGISAGTDPLPTEFSFENKLLWKTELGDGIGSAIIVDGRVFNTAMTGEKTFAVFCHDGATGKQL